MKYLDYVLKGYEPGNEEVIVSFFVKPTEGFAIEEVAGAIAAESSTGTWTELVDWYDAERVRKLSAKAYEFKRFNEGWILKISYPTELFEYANLPGFLASVAGNIFGMRRVAKLKILDIRIPKDFLKGFKGPLKGLGVKKIFGIDRPIVGTVPKPKVGYNVEEVERLAYELLIGGLDFVKDDENLASPSFCKFEERCRKIMKVIEKVEKETGERKAWFANITADIREMEKRLKLVADHGNPYVMIDVVIVGWSSLTYLRDLAEDHNLAIHGHRAMHAAFTRHDHGISMFTLAKLYRIIGVDQLHIGTAGFGKLESARDEAIQIAEMLKNEIYIPKNEFQFHQNFWGLKKVMPVSSGGLHPGVLPMVIEILGKDLVLQIGGGVLGHPDGARAGAKAVRQALEAVEAQINIEEFARGKRELSRALEKWGKRAHI
ncbi:MAG: type III ribulose-bisphosphate carboxylase [Archaeoglobaceae archaeon]|nr:type III ribulose-bisphosphate carboxylase [Archaeoglobaceae archaeon]MDW7989261.1 type III ribulose-bisphosphate carboxylase [Archaeoglobaceae archaeon]